MLTFKKLTSFNKSKNIKNDIKNDIEIEYYPNGNVRSIVRHFDDNISLHILYNYGGELVYKYYTKDGKLNGPYIIYSKDNKVTRIDNYSKDKCINFIKSNFDTDGLNNMIYVDEKDQKIID